MYKGAYDFEEKDGGSAGGNVLLQNPDNYPAVEPAANGSYPRLKTIECVLFGLSFPTRA